jgi:hypothetical protein
LSLALAGQAVVQFGTPYRPCATSAEHRSQGVQVAGFGGDLHSARSNHSVKDSGSGRRPGRRHERNQ